MSTQPVLRVSERIRLAMVLNHTNQADIGRLLGLGQSAISDRLRGRVDWRAQEIVALAEYLRVSPSYLLGEGEAL